MYGFIGLLGAGLIIWGVISSVQNSNDFNAWNKQCNQAGGQISRTGSGFFSTRYECFIDGKMVTLPGWEGK